MAFNLTQIKANAFNEIVKDAGLVLSTFDPTGVTEISQDDILYTTSGGVSVTCKPTVEDWFADVDNAPNGTIEGEVTTDWECSLSFTYVGFNENAIKKAIGSTAAGTNGTAGSGANSFSYHTIKPRDAKATDNLDIWFVAPKTNGGYVAAHLKRARSSEGFSMQTSKKGKSTGSVTFKGHFTCSDVKDIPMEFIIAEPIQINVVENQTTTTG